MRSTQLRTMTGRLVICAGLVVGIISAPTVSSAAPVSDRVDLRVLVVSDGGSNVTAIATQLAREGVPTTVLDLTSASRPTIDAAFLENAAGREGRFQGIVLTGPGGLGAGELSAISDYERRYGVREVDAYVYPNASFGTMTPSYSGVLDGSPVTVQPAAKAAGFGYLNGALTVDDVDPTVAEVYGYLASGQVPQPAGESYTPLLTATAGGVTGSIMGVHTAGGRSQLVITAAFNAYQKYFLELGHGIITWLTRGIHLGIQRNYFAVQVDDVFLADSQWSAAANCTPGDDCFGADAGITTPDIRMQAADVTNLVSWQNAHGMRLDMVFNGGGSDDHVADSGGQPDPLLAAFQQNVGRFTWINHTYSHEYLGCIQVAPPVAGQPWWCATAADYANPSTVFIDPDLAHNHAQLDPATGIYYLTQAEIESQIGSNLSWAQAHGIPTNPAQLVTGEHSGLAILPQQPADSPHLVPALTARGVTALAADASRGSASRVVGPARTVPRHPMNIFYNVDTYFNEVDEYNWIYTSQENGGSGICQRQPEITTCITPLPAGSDADATASFTNYILPRGISQALSFALSNDPRPFYVHQSNLTGQRIVYPLLEGILSAYRSVYAEASTPLVHLDLIGQAQVLARTGAWTSGMSGVTAYVDASGVHVDGNGAGIAIPVTVPAGSALKGVTLDSYGGERSGWIAPPATDTVVAVPPVPSGGYVGVPDAPAIGAATAGNASATVTWSAAAEHGSAVTGYLVRAYLADSPTAAVTVPATANATSLTVTGLLNWDSYRFRVSATSAAGEGDVSALSNAVVPTPTVPGAPAIGTATAGDSTATVSWSAPGDGGSPITLYTVRLYTGASSTPSSGQDVSAGTTSATFTGLTNGTAYSFDVFAYNAFGPGPVSARSASVTPAPPGIPGAPALTSATAGRDRATVRWAAPSNVGSSPIRSYKVAAYLGDATTPVATRSVGSRSRSAVMTGLNGGTTYTFDVVAVNTAGAGPGSDRSAPVVPYAAPAAPAITSAVPHNGSVTLTWTPPDAHSSAITRYQVAVYLGILGVPFRYLTVSGSQNSVTVTGLLNGWLYGFEVRARNGAGYGPWSARSGFVAPA